MHGREGRCLAGPGVARGLPNGDDGLAISDGVVEQMRAGLYCQHHVIRSYGALRRTMPASLDSLLTNAKVSIMASRSS